MLGIAVCLNVSGLLVFTRYGDLSVDKVYLEVTPGKRVRDKRNSLRFRAAHGGTNTGHHFTNAEQFANKITGAGVETLHFVAFISPGTEQDIGTCDHS